MPTGGIGPPTNVEVVSQTGLLAIVPTVLTAAVSGGPRLGGTTTPSADFFPPVHGGPRLGSTTLPSDVFTVTASGGVKLGEVIQPSIGFTPVSAGGAVLGSLSQGTTDSVFTVTTSGGAVLGNTQPQPGIGFFPSVGGGAVLGSTTAPSGTWTITSRGGLILGSATVPSSPHTVLGTGGGPVLGSTTTLPGIAFTVTSHGGIVVGSHSFGFTDAGEYHVYMNHGNGDAVNYDFPVDTTSLTTWTTGLLPYPGDYSFHVRAFWASDFDEEHNLDARVRVVLDATGADVTGRPAAPTGLAAATQKGGTVRLSWLYKTPGGRALPSKFNVYAGTPGVSYAAYVQQVAYGSDGRYFAVVSGLMNGRTYQFVVRAANATAEEPNTTIVTATSDSSGPNPPESLISGSI